MEHLCPHLETVIHCDQLPNLALNIVPVFWLYMSGLCILTVFAWQ